MWLKIASLLLRNRHIMLVSIIAITAFMIFQASKVQLDYHHANMLSESHPVYVDNEKFKEIFGEEANVIVCGFKDEDFFNIHKFNNLQSLCSELEKIDYVENIFTVSNAVNLRQITVMEGHSRPQRVFEAYNIFPDGIKSQKELDSLKRTFKSLPFYQDILYNDSANVYLLFVTISHEILNTPQRIPTVKEIERQVRQFSADNEIPVRISGMPYIRTHMLELMKKEIILFIILAVLICIIILYIFFRSFKVVIISISVVGIGVVWAIGLMGILSLKITILTAIIPPLLVVIGIPNTIFLLNKYHAEIKKHRNKMLALKRSIAKIGNAIFLTNITTAAGFSTFIITNSRYLVEFGITAALGIIFVFFIALILIPCIFSFLEIPSRKSTKHLDYKFLNRFVGLLLIIVLKHRPKVYASVVFIIIVCIFGLLKVERTGYFLDDIKKDDPIYLDLKFFEKHFNGISPMEIAIGSKDSLSSGEKIAHIEKLSSLQEDLLKYPELSKSRSIADAVKFLYQAFSRGRPENYKLPPYPATYETIFERLPENIDKDLMSAYINNNHTITRVSVNIEDIGTDRMEELLPQIQADINNYFPEDKYNSILTGSTILYYVGSQYLITNLFISLSLAFIVISIILFLMFRSFKMVVISLVPNVIPMIITAAIMGYFGIPLKPSTILVFSIAFGISVDDTIHYLAKYRQELQQNASIIGISAKIALKETSISMIYTSVVLFFGFAIFAASDFGGTVALGILVSTALLFAMLSNLIFLPALLMSLNKYFYNKK